MKKIFCILSFIIVLNSISFADEIYMNDLRVIKGKIIQVTDKNVEFSQEGKPLLIVPREKVFKIKYDNGQVVQIADLKGEDKIFLKDGSVIKGMIVKVTPDVIIYSVADKQEAAVRDNVVKIEYADGKVIRMSEGQIVTEPVKTEGQQPQQPETLKTEPAERSGGFIDSYIWFGMIGEVSDISGNINNKEKRIYNKNEFNFSKYDDPYFETSGYHFGFDLNLMLPAIKFKQSRGFDLTGVKFGIKATYVISEIYQELREEDGDLISDGKLLKYRSINAGPEINLVFSPRSDLFNMVIQFYALGGYIHDGRLTAAPALRDANVPLTDSYSANFTGRSFTVGVGNYFVLNKSFPLTVGYGFFYSYSRIEFDKNVAIYNGAKNASFDEFGIMLSVGVHF